MKKLISYRAPSKLDVAFVAKVMVCEHFGITFDELMSAARKREIVWPRQLVMWLLNEVTDFGSVRIGKCFDRDHGTVLHAWKAVNDQRETESDVSALLAQLRSELAGKIKAA